MVVGDEPVAAGFFMLKIFMKKLIKSNVFFVLIYRVIT